MIRMHSIDWNVVSFQGRSTTGVPIISDFIHRALIYLDNIGPFVLKDRVNKYILTIVDGFTKYVVLYAVKNVTMTEAVYFVRDFICAYGRPQQIIIGKGYGSVIQKILS